MREARTWSICALVLVIAACGPDKRRDGITGGGMMPDANYGADGNNGCPQGTDLVYVIDQFANKISSFDPSSKTFADLGQLFCPTMSGATPFSMGVDRNGIAWVLYNSGELFHVELLNQLKCTKTTWAGSGGLMTFGMGFSTDMPGGTTDSLFIGGGTIAIPPVNELAKVDLNTMTATKVGNVPILPEMTGNSKAELWGFMPDTTTPKVVQFNKADATFMKEFDLPQIAGGMAGYAFAHWGGDYWIFLQKNAEIQSSVYQVDGTTGMIVSTTVATGRTIVGAGVSTCAPIVIM